MAPRSTVVFVWTIVSEMLRIPVAVLCSPVVPVVSPVSLIVVTKTQSVLTEYEPEVQTTGNRNG